MGGVSGRIDLLGLDATQARFKRADTLARDEAVKVIQEAAAPMLAEIKGQAFTGIQRHAAASVAIRKDRLGIELAGAAQGDSLDRVLYYGGEYGGRKPKRITYATRSPRGRVYTVRRRTTMQFLPHLGRQGYMVWPTVRDTLPKINKTIGEQVAKVLGGD